MAGIPMVRLNSGGKIPAIGFGTWQLAEGNEIKNTVGEALRAGYRLIDTAAIYGNEKGVGEAIRASGVPRDEIFLTTKLWPSDFGYDQALQAFEESLNRLGMQYVDLYLLHWPEDDNQARLDAWRALIKLNQERLARNIGVSNFHPEHIQELSNETGVTPAVNQIAFHPFIYKEQLPIVKFAKEQDIAIEAYSPLSRAYQFDEPLLKEVAAANGRTVAQIMLRWAIQQGTIPIPKSAHRDRIKQNLQVFDFELSEGDIAKLNSLSGKVKAP